MSNESGAPPRARDVLAATWARGLVGVAALLVLAEVLGRSGAINPSVLPLASTVLARAVGLAGNPRFLGDLAATIGAWAAGLAITVAVAVPSGLVLGSVPGVRTAAHAVVEFLRPIPAVALIPLAALILGPGLRMNVTLIVYAAIWPVLFNTIYGVGDVDPVAKETLRAFGFGRLDVVRRVSLPAAAPFIFTGIQVASSIAIILNIGTGVVTGRIEGNGIGAFIADANASGGNTALVLAAALWAGVLGLALNGLLVWSGRRMLPWHRAYLGEQSLGKMR
ncbi:MAG: NitT/TauT family transport system permease protein [Streptosporangiaceae bacterium]|jgi:NitT/TauT family transport system permease protein|nr:NitT/TauT family transport system permease protein [Streptosporangiaceae bacterium]